MLTELCAKPFTQHYAEMFNVHRSIINSQFSIFLWWMRIRNQSLQINHKSSIKSAVNGLWVTVQVSLSSPRGCIITNIFRKQKKAIGHITPITPLPHLFSLNLGAIYILSKCHPDLTLFSVLPSGACTRFLGCECKWIDVYPILPEATSLQQVGSAIIAQASALLQGQA